MARILAIDDAEVFRRQIKEILAEYEVLEAVDGMDGLDKLQSSGHFDLIICDLNMPNMDGIAFCQKKYENKAFSQIPIIMITTESNVEIKKWQRVLELELGCSNLLIPPALLMV